MRPRLRWVTLCLVHAWCAAVHGVRVYPPGDCILDHTPPPGDTVQFAEYTRYSKDTRLNTVIRFPVAPTDLGSEWENRSQAAPEYGLEFRNAALAARLRTTPAIGPAAWADLNITGLEVYHYVLVDGDYFVPKVVVHSDYEAYTAAWTQHRVQTPRHYSERLTYNRQGRYFRFQSQCILTSNVSSSSQPTDHEEFAPGTLNDFKTLVPTNILYSQMQHTPRVQFRMKEDSDAGKWITALMALDDTADHVLQFAVMTGVLEHKILNGAFRGADQMFLDRTWHQPAILRTAYNLTYMVANMSYTHNGSASAGCEEDKYACIDGNEEVPFFCFDMQYFCFEQVVCTWGQYASSSGRCSPMPESYVNTRGGALARIPVNNPMFLAFYDPARGYLDDIIAMERLDDTEKAWRVELFLTEASLRHGAAAVVANLSRRIEGVERSQIAKWEYATYDLEGGGAARDMERLVLELRTTADVGVGRPNIASEVFSRDQCIDVRSGQDEEISDYADWEKTIRDGKMTMVKTTTDAADSMQAYRATIEPKGATLTFQAGVYTLQAGCIIYQTGYDQYRMSMMYDVLVREIRRQYDRRLDKTIRVLWWYNELTVGMRIGAGADRGAEYEELKRITGDYILSTMQPAWDTCYPDQAWTEYRMEGGDGLEMVATHRLGPINASCENEPPCPADRPHRDMVLCAPILGHTGEDSFECTYTQRMCLSAPLCSRGRFRNGTACSNVPAGMFSLDRRTALRKPQGDAVFDMVYGLVSSDNFLGNTVQTLERGATSGWLMSIAPDTYLRQLGPEALANQIKASIAGDARLEVTYANPAGRRLLADADSAPEWTFAIREQAGTPAVLEPTPTPTPTEAYSTATPTPTPTEAYSTATPTPTPTEAYSTATPTPTPTEAYNTWIAVLLGIVVVVVLLFSAAAACGYRYQKQIAHPRMYALVAPENA